MNEKILLKAGNMLNSVPVILVNCRITSEKYNIITVAWSGTTYTNPPMCYISIFPNRYS